MGAKQNYVFVLRGFVLELEQILKMTVCELGKAGLHAQIRIEMCSLLKMAIKPTFSKAQQVGEFFHAPFVP